MTARPPRRRNAGATTIEVHASRNRPLGMTPARFLRDYWQKRPLLIRGAFPQFHNALSPNDLAGIACQESALARIVIRDARRDRWRLRNGPFAESDFARLPKSRWTLLVQDVDKWEADVAALLDQFAFLPAWRIDDVMVSYAVDGGGVGAHVDNYDVFLVQGRGRRRWRINTDAAASQAFRDDAELKLLKHFEPNHDWVLDPGDVLYLPPGIAHEGVAIGECMTYSVGMRAPSMAELIVDFAESIAEPLDETLRYVDPDLAPARDPHEIDAAAVTRAERVLSRLRDLDAAALQSWFGRFVTRYRSAHDALPSGRALSVATLRAKLSAASVLRNPWSRAAWVRKGHRADLFIAGDVHACSRPLARLLAGRRANPGATLLRAAGKGDLALLTQLVNAGHLALVDARPAGRRAVPSR